MTNHSATTPAAMMAPASIASQKALLFDLGSVCTMDSVIISPQGPRVGPEKKCSTDPTRGCRNAPSVLRGELFDSLLTLARRVHAGGAIGVMRNDVVLHRIWAFHAG